MVRQYFKEMKRKQKNGLLVKTGVENCNITNVAKI